MATATTVAAKLASQICVRVIPYHGMTERCRAGNKPRPLSGALLADRLITPRIAVQALDAFRRNDHELAHLHAGLAVARNDVRLHHDGLPGTERLGWHRSSGAAFGAENRLQVAGAIAVQQIVDDGEAGRFDDAGGLDHLGGYGAGPQYLADGVEGGVGRLVQVAIERGRRFA